MPRAIWKGAISFGLVHIPVELFPAQSRKGIDLDMLDRRDFAPVGYKLYNKNTGKDVERKDTVKGYAVDDGNYVVLTEEDLKRANVEATQTIDIQAFVNASEVSPIYFEQPYYLAPAKGGDKVYVLLRETLKRSGKIAIAQIVIRTKQHLAALLPLDNAILLNMLRYHDEIRPLKDIALPDENSKRAAVSDKEIKMALSLLEDMTEPWNPALYHDTYHDDVLAMIEKKVEANQTKTITEPTGEPGRPASSNVVDLMELLKKSIGNKSKPATAPATKKTSAKTTPKKTTPARGRTSSGRSSARSPARAAAK